MYVGLSPTQNTSSSVPFGIFLPLTTLALIPASIRVEKIENFDTKTFCEEIGREAWGFIEYQEPLTKGEADAYEFTLGGMKTFWCVTTAVYDSGNVVANITGTVEAKTSKFFFVIHSRPP